jgi:hypothetical protein
MPRTAMMCAAALFLAACGSTHAAPRRTSTVATGSHVLKGCYSLPFSGGEAELRPVNNYRVDATVDRICFRLIGAGSKCSPAGMTRSYGDPIIDTDEPRSGDYAVVYYPSEHRWFLAPGCPSS